MGIQGERDGSIARAHVYVDDFRTTGTTESVGRRLGSRQFFASGRQDAAHQKRQAEVDAKGIRRKFKSSPARQAGKSDTIQPTRRDGVQLKELLKWFGRENHIIEEWITNSWNTSRVPLCI
jgi:hypothetical protein